MSLFGPDCGKRFAYLLSSPDGEVGITDPCGLMCSGEDRERALARLEQVREMIRERWDQVMDAENDRQDWPATREVDPIYTAWLARANEIPDNLISLQLRPHIDEIWSLVSEGACILDALTIAAEGYELPTPTPFVPDPPKPPPSPLRTLAVLGGLGLAAGIVIALARR